MYKPQHLYREEKLRYMLCYNGYAFSTWTYTYVCVACVCAYMQQVDDNVSGERQGTKVGGGGQWGFVCKLSTFEIYYL